ncbi:hypothetical protein EON80_21055 [bacterium]|nr:MAG: hypothetical protein EON80_21055 [bacterium]
MLPGVLIGAEYRGLRLGEAILWRLAIDDEGHLFQDVEISSDNERRQEQIDIGPEAVMQLLLKAEALEFQSRASD